MQNNSLAITQRVVTLPAGVSTQLAPGATWRSYLAFMNIGADNATLGFGQPAVVGQGWPLFAAGGGYTMTNGEGVPSNLVTAISVAGTTVVVLEG